MNTRRYLILIPAIAAFAQPVASAGEYKGPVVGPLPENNGYYALFFGSTYKNMSWEKARVFAESQYIVRGGKRFVGFLFTPNTVTENAFVKKALDTNEMWIGLFQAPGAKGTADNWRFLNNRTPTWWGWGSGEPDDQKKGALTRCSFVSFFDGMTFTTDGQSVSFTSSSNHGKETGCENCGMIRADGKWKDKECKKHGNGFIVEFRNM